MCGISVIIAKKNEPRLNEIVQKMNDKIIHRGPDAQGYFYDEMFAFGHRRLKIIDLSDDAAQPMKFENLVINYNGEVYNYIELREELIASGYSFKSQSDTEVVLKAYHAWGIDSFRKFNGMWAFSIFNSDTREIIFCRDHFGIKPLQYYISDNFFAAASEIKQFFVVPDFQAFLNMPVALDFLYNGLLNTSEETFFRNVKELRGGYYLKYSLKKHTYDIQKWYNFKPEKLQPGTTYESATKKVHNLLTESINIRCRSDVKLGSCLSGGIDSSAMVCILHDEKIKGFHAETITSCYVDKNYDEQKFSDLVSQKTGFRSLKVFPSLDSFLENDAEKIIYHQDQPIPSASHFSEFSVFKTAKENGLTVMLDGQGSDEYFGGYGEFFTVYLFELLKRGKLLKIFKLMKIKALQSSKPFYLVFRSFTVFLFEQRFKAFLNRILGKFEFPDSFFQANTKKKYHSIFEKKLKKHKSFIHLSADETFTTSIPYQLHSEDRNSMMFSVESRLPYLDFNLMEYGISLPTEFKIKNGIHKSVLRDAVDSLPPEIKNRKDKMGFVAPEAPWFLENAKKIQPEITEAIKIFNGIFDESLISYFDKTVVNEKKYHPFFFRLWSFYKWYKIFNVKLN